MNRYEQIKNKTEKIDKIITGTVDPQVLIPHEVQRNIELSIIAEILQDISESLAYLCSEKGDCTKTDVSVKEWLESFNTESATECFTAVQRLKDEVEI